ncbi:MAG: SirB2 family protein [Betaproteobacteria bacterium]
MDYALLKTVHQSAVVISFAGFLVRGVGMLNDAAWLRHRAVKTLPHVVDTILIVSAVWLAWILRLTPANAPWIGAKIIGLLVYIAVGMIALRFGRTKGVRASAWIGAMLVFGYIVSVALTKDPRGFLLWL